MAKSKINDSNYLEVVRHQYENYPYPPRNPETEQNVFVYCHPCALDTLNYYHFSGKRDFSKHFRALVAGGGTGDATIMLAEQLKGFDADIVHLDISEASIEVAKNRAKIRGLDNITWIHGSLLDAQKLVTGKFDYINCSGVLHHLEAPQAGLSALEAVLQDDGVIDIMLYAKYGRESVYQIQNLMKILNKNENNLQTKVDNCKSVLRNLPATSGFAAMQNIFADIQTYGDVGIYDLLLHSNDVAYSIPDVYKFLSGCNLNLSHLFFDQYYLQGNNLYKLESYIKDPILLSTVEALSLEEKQSAAELMHGKIVKHSFYAAKTKAPLPSLDDLDNVPVLSMALGSAAYKEIAGLLKRFLIGQEVVCNAHHLEARFIKTTNAERIFSSMDGYKNIKEIFKDVRASYSANEKKPTNAELKQEFEGIFKELNLQDWIFLRDKSVPRAKTLDEISSKFGIS